MPLTSAQLTTLKADLAANTNTVSYGGASVQIKNIAHTPDGAFAVADWYNLTASPDFWAWRTSVSQLEIVTGTSIDGTTWSWTDFIARSQAERDGWSEMFADGGRVNAALPNTRQGFLDIFSGPAGVAQRAHLVAIGRRKVTNIEKLLATGTGSTGSPATMGFEGPLVYADIMNAWSAA